MKTHGGKSSKKKETKERRISESTYVLEQGKDICLK